MSRVGGSGGRVRVAALQTDIVWEDRDANFVRLRPWIAAAAAAGARLVVLPEMFACGFSMDSQRVAEPPDGPTVSFLAEESRRHGVWLAGSLPERDDTDRLPANTLVVVDPTGAVRARYHKIHPFTHAGEHEAYRAGNDRVTVEVEGLRVTLFVCYDLRFADDAWECAAETDAYVWVANWPEPRRRHWRVLLEARAIENQAWVVGVNRVGRDPGLRYAGDSRVVSPSGEVVAAAAEGETMLLADLDAAEVERVRRALPFLRDRER